VKAVTVSRPDFAKASVAGPAIGRVANIGRCAEDTKEFGRNFFSREWAIKRNIPMAIRLNRITLAKSWPGPRNKSDQTVILIDSTWNSDRDADRLAAAVADLSEELARMG
jgi:hypothetical protein